MDLVAGLTVVEVATPSWVRVDACPPIVMVALRLFTELLAVIVTVTVPLPEPLDGDTLAHAESEMAVQLVFEVTVIV